MHLHDMGYQIVTDNGTQYTSKEFKNFANEWKFKHTTSSPKYPQSNGLSKASVKIVKTMIKKANNRQEIMKGLMIIRNTPLQCGKSPAQLIFNKTLEDNLPRLHNQNISQNYYRDLGKERAQQKATYDKKIPENPLLSTFKKNQRVAIQHHNSKEWSIRGTIVNQVAPRSYRIHLDDGSFLRRNSKDIRRVYNLIAEPSNHNPTQQNSDMNRITNSNTLETQIRSIASNTNASDIMEGNSSSDETIPYNEESESDNGDEYGEAINTSNNNNSSDETIPYNEESDSNNENDYDNQRDSDDCNSDEDNEFININDDSSEETQYITRHGRIVKRKLKEHYLYTSLC